MADIEKNNCEIMYYDDLISETNIEKDYQIKELNEEINKWESK